MSALCYPGRNAAQAARASARAAALIATHAMAAGGLILFLSFSACTRDAGLPQTDSREYRDLVSAFYIGLAGLQTGEDVRAKEKLALAARIAPGEPASWANLGLLAVRQQEFDAAYENVEKARALAPENSQIEALLGLIESRRGRLPEAITHFTRAVELDAGNLKALYALAQETERQGTETSDGEAQQLLGRILRTQPANLAVLLDVVRLAAKRGDGEALRNAVAALGARASAWPDEAKQQLAALQQAAAGPAPRAAATQSAFLKNVLARVPAYRQSMNAVKTPAEFVGDPFQRFIKLPSPSSRPASPDTAMRFAVEPFPGRTDISPAPFMAAAFDAESGPSLLSISQKPEGIQIAGGGLIPVRTINSAWGIELLDFDYDFKRDLVIVSRQGVRFHRQQTPGNFVEATAGTKLPPKVLAGEYSSAQAFDFDLDGDLDLLLFPFSASPEALPITLLRNNGDGTFKEQFPFPDLKGGGVLNSADLDGDGDPDLAFLMENRLRVFTNERLGQYLERPAPQALGDVESLTIADLNSDGALDLVLLNRDGRILRLSDQDAGKDWQVAEVARVGAWLRVDEHGPAIGLQLADLDNSGSLDLIAKGGHVLLGDAQGGFVPINLPPEIQAAAISDLNNDGRLDLIGIQRGGKAVQLINRGARNYHSQTIRTRAAQSTGDQRINSFGIGGEIEIRSGLLTQKQVITSPLLHFGLGENMRSDVARIVWPNGLAQAEFELNGDQSVLAEQRLKGSCPTLFAWDGKRMSFVKDCSPWNPALGLRVNAQVVANVEQTEEWFKIPGKAIAQRDGLYDLRVTGELWEAFYIDKYSLTAVDHPPGTEVFTDERFAMPQPKPRLYVTTPPKPFVAARDDRGQDVSAEVASLDRQYLDTFGRGQYQGVTRDHWVELELGADAPRDKKLYLIGHGWLHPTDATINIAIGQGGALPPQGLRLEVPDEKGNWITAKPGLGFLSGKLKTMVIDLDGVFRPGAPRRLRLRTNMEIYWDQLEWAEAVSAAQVKIHPLSTAGAELRYRGFSRFTRANASSPELPDYNQLEGAAPKWRDLTGYYTRYGDVRELLAQTDDRMLIMNAGDELRLTFAAPPAPPADWARDFVMVGDGWTKDGDYNCVHAATVLPLPFHGIREYNRASIRLEDNPAYKRHPQDWREYHIRYVTPDNFRNALR
ncbi:MAG: FG-GAP-like repeat-containing protein [Blastocatellia bacterium]|nr:FG-GAP-like repeat-containing protein [Blastocatellia bacterium]